MIGILGSVIFEVSVSKVSTFRDFKRTKGACYAEHAVFGDKPLLEFTGLKANTISLKMQLSTSLGVTPTEKIASLTDMCDLGLAVPLIIGGEVMGLWVIESLSESWDCVDNKGSLISATVDISLKEYPDG
ncbi:MAG: phage tail protein [Synergistales bacterium]|nr:phage tail protein [Synergistales bacterium]